MPVIMVVPCTCITLGHPRVLWPGLDGTVAEPTKRCVQRENKAGFVGRDVFRLLKSIPRNARSEVVRGVVKEEECLHNNHTLNIDAQRMYVRQRWTDWRNCNIEHYWFMFWRKINIEEEQKHIWLKQWISWRPWRGSFNQILSELLTRNQIDWKLHRDANSCIRWFADEQFWRFSVRAIHSMEGAGHCCSPSLTSVALNDTLNNKAFDI